MSVVAGTAQHCIFSVDFLWEENAVAVEGQEGILALEKLLEVECVTNAYGGAVVAVAPGYPVTVLNPGYTWVILVFRLNHFGIAGLEHNGLVLYLPIDAVFAETGKDVHLHCLVVAAEHACIAILEGYYSAVEDAV